MKARRSKLIAAFLSTAAATGLALNAAPAAESAVASVNFSAAGDFGWSNNTKAVFESIHARNDDLTIAIGDMSYAAAGTEPAWCTMVTRRVGTSYPVELIAGNHESDDSTSSIDDFAKCLPNRLPGLSGTYARQYYVDVPANAPLVRFIMASPNLKAPDGSWWSYSTDTWRYNWTASAIDSARAKGIPWVIASVHKPCLSLGNYGCEKGSDDLMNLLVRKKVDLVLNGHEHFYQRTKQLGLSASCPSIVPNAYSSSCVKDADNQVVKNAGTIFATVGTGGYELRDIPSWDAESKYFAASSGKNRNPSFGSLAVTLDASHLTARFIPVRTGTFTDSVTIS